MLASAAISICNLNLFVMLRFSCEFLGIDFKLNGKIREKIIWLVHHCAKLAIPVGGVVIAVPDYMFAARQHGWPFALALGFTLIIYGATWFYGRFFCLLIIYSVMFFINVNDILQR